MSWLQGFAQLLANENLGTYSETEAYPSGAVGIAVETMPDKPSLAAALYSQPGNESYASIGVDQPVLHVIVRGNGDPRTSRSLADRIYDTLHGRTNFTLPDGSRVVLCVGTQAGPTTLGQDASGRHAHDLKFIITLNNPTQHRP